MTLRFMGLFISLRTIINHYVTLVYTVTMRFVRGVPEDIERVIAARIGTGLTQGRHVLWLTSGGSNVELQVEIMRRLRTTVTDGLERLSILPIDERYGPSGHADSNVQQLRAAGFEPGAARWIDILAADLPLPATVEGYTEAARSAFAEADLIVGQFGMGADGHVAGILPDSPACTDAAATVIGYDWSDYTRLTLTIDTLKRIQIAYVAAFGESKRLALERLERNKEAAEKLPAKILYDIAEVYVYTDTDLATVLAKA